MEYMVQWSIVLDANSPEEAARLAQKIQRDPLSLATLYDITDENGKETEIDLEIL